MRIRDHVLLSTGGAVMLYPWLRRRVVVPWAASILIDADHYLWFCVHERSLSPFAAMRFFNQAQPPQHLGTRLLHSPGMLWLFLLLSARWRWAAYLLLGMAFHVSIDTYHEVRTGCARRAALYRDRFTCRRCGVRGPAVVAHLRQQPKLLPSYRLEYFESLCPPCHEQAHRQAALSVAGSSLKLSLHAATM